MYHIEWSNQFEEGWIGIPRIELESGLVEYYLRDLEEEKEKVDPNEVAIMATHLSAIRTFLASNQLEAIIWEGEIPENTVFRRTNLPSDFSLLALSYFLSDEEDKENLSWAGVDPSQENLCFMPSSLSGPLAYLITREWAQEVLTILDRPWRYLLPPHRSASAILTLSPGYLLYPSL